VESYELPQATFQAVSLHHRVTMPWDNDRDARIVERGSAHPDIEIARANPLPLSDDILEIRFPRQAQ
jgi:hypothetical protein